MIDDYLDDTHELEADVYSKNSKTPQQVQSYLFNDVYKRDWKLYLNSIEWDGLWLKHDTPEEAEEKQRLIRERKQQIEMENSPFAKWF
jgi:hypothetical protein